MTDQQSAYEVDGGFREVHGECDLSVHDLGVGLHRVFVIEGRIAADTEQRGGQK